MRRLSHGLCAVGFVATALLSPPAGAEPPHGAPKPGASGNAAGKPADAGGKPGPHGEKNHPKDSPADKDHGQGNDDRQRAPGKEEAGDRVGNGRSRGALRSLRDELKSGALKKEDLGARLAKWRESNKERQQTHRAALKARWGESLSKPDVKQELELHERRMARLSRMLLLAQTDKTGKDAEKLATRIDKLVDLETARHEKRMAQISGGAAPAASAAPPAAALNDGASK